MATQRNHVWLVQEFDVATGYEAQGRPDRLLHTTLFYDEERAKDLAKALAAPGRRVDCREQFVN